MTQDESNNPLKFKTSVYDDLGLKNAGISFEDFDSQFTNNLDFRKSIYGDLGLEDKGIKYEEFELVGGIQPPKQGEVSTVGSENTSQPSTEPSQVSQGSSNYNPQVEQIEGGINLGVPSNAVYNEATDTYEVELPEAEVTGVVPKLTFLESIKNSAKNALTQIKGIDDRISLVATDVYENLLGDEVAREFYKWSDRDLDTVRENALAEIDNLSSQMQATYSITGGLDNNDLSQVIGGGLNAISALASSAVAGIATGGVGIYTEMAGNSLVDFNKDKAERLGISVKELYAKGEAEFGVPFSIGVASGFLEKLGLKGVSKGMISKLGEPFAKKIASLAVSGGTEGMTEWLQTGLDNMNRFIAKNPKASIGETHKSFLDGLYSKEGLESFLGGVAGGFGGSAIGRLARIPSVLKSTKNTISKNFSKLTTASKELTTNGDMSEGSRRSLEKQVADSSKAIATALEEDSKVQEGLPRQVNEQIDIIQTELDALQTVLEDPNVSDITKAEVEKQLSELDNQINSLVEEILKEDSTNDKANQKGVSSKYGEGRQESVETESNQGTSQETAETSGVLQKAPQEVDTVIPKEVTDNIKNKDFLQDRADKLAESIKQRWSKLGNSNLGIKSQESFEDWVQGNKDAALIVKEATEYAFIKLAQGSIKSAKQLGTVLGISNSNISKKIFEDAKAKYTEYKATVIKPKLSTKQVVNKNTSRGIQGTVTKTAKQAMKDYYTTLAKGANTGATFIRDFNKGVNNYIKEQAKAKNLKGLKFTSGAIRSITAKMASLKDEKSYDKFIEVIDNLIENATHRKAFEDALGLQKKVVATAKLKGLPKDMVERLKEFSKIKPSDLINVSDPKDFSNVEKYSAMLADIVNAKKKVTSVSKADMDALIEVAKKNAEDNTPQTPQAQKDAERSQKLKDKLISSGVSQSDIDAIDDGSKSVADVVLELQEKFDSTKESNEAKARGVASEYLAQVNADKEKVEAMMDVDTDKQLFREFLDKFKDVTALSDRDLSAFNLVMFNVLSSGSIAGLGRFTVLGEGYTRRGDKSSNATVMNVLRTPSAFFRNVLAGGYRTGFRLASYSQIMQAITKSVRDVGKLHTFTGFVDNQINANKAFKQVLEIRKKSEAIFKKYNSDLNNGVANIKASIYADVVQFQKSWDDARIEEEYKARFQAWGLSLQRIEDVKNSEFKDKNEELIKNTRTALEDVATESVDSDGKITWTPKVTKEEFYNSLPAGQKAYYDFTQEIYKSIKDKHLSGTKFYLGLNVTTDVENYTPRSYSQLMTADEALVERELSSSIGKINELITSPFSQSVTKENTGTGQNRVIEGDRLPIGSFLNADFIDTFLNESSAMIYDVETMGSRQLMSNMVDFKKNGLDEYMDDEVPFNLYKQMIASKIKGDKLQLRFSSIPPTALQYIGRKMGTLGTVKALGGVSQYVKQLSPLVEVWARVSPMAHAKAMQLWATNPEYVAKVLSMGDTFLRDAYETKQPKATKNKINPDDLGTIRKMLLKAGLGADAVTEVLAKVSLAPLQHMDSLVAKLGWMSFYIDQTMKNNGGTIDLSKVDKDAIAYANTQNSTVMNESDPALQATFTKNVTVANISPYVSFAINAKIGWYTSLSKIKRVDKAKDRASAVLEFAGAVGNTIAFNMIGQWLRGMAIYGGSQFLVNTIDNFYGDDEDDEKLLKEKEELIAETVQHTDRNIMLNDIRSKGYLIQDLLFGGILSNYVEPVSSPIVDYFVESMYTEKELEAVGYGETKLKIAGDFDNLIAVTGSKGIFFKGIYETMKQLATQSESKKDYVIRKEGKLNAERSGVVVDSALLTQEGIEANALPEWFETVYSTSSLINILSSMGLSEQVTNSFSRQSTNLARKVLQKKHGVVSKRSVEDLIKSANDLDKLEIKGNSIPINPDQKAEYLADRLNIVKELKSSTKYGESSRKRSKLTVTEYESYISKLADESAKKNFYKANRQLIYDMGVTKKELEREEEEARKKRVEYERSLNSSK